MKKLSFEEDISRSMESIKNKMGKEYRIKNNATVEQAVNQIYDDLDVSLVMCSDKAHVNQRLKVVSEAMKRLGVYDEDVRTKKVSDFLSPEYLVHESMRNQKN